MPNKQKNCCKKCLEDNQHGCNGRCPCHTPTECTVCDGSGFVLGTQLCTNCTLTPTVSKWEEEVESVHSLIFKGALTPHELRIWVRGIRKEVLSSKIDEVIGMIEGMIDEQMLNAEPPMDGESLAIKITEKIKSTFASSLKQKLEAKRKEI